MQDVGRIAPLHSVLLRPKWSIVFYSGYVILKKDVERLRRFEGGVTTIIKGLECSRVIKDREN